MPVSLKANWDPTPVHPPKKIRVPSGLQCETPAAPSER
jgi:hypothetical protein